MSVNLKYGTNVLFVHALLYLVQNYSSFLDFVAVMNTMGKSEHLG